MNPKVDAFIENLTKWQDELEQLRVILLDCQLTEEFKWRGPCYSYQNKNIAIINGFKDYCVLSFFKGALLKDSHKIMVKPGDNTQSARMIRFTSREDILQKEAILKTYIYQAIEVERAGLKVEFKSVTEYDRPEEFDRKIKEVPKLKEAFEALTPGRQKAYLLHFAAAKQSQTRESRIEKYIPRILAGKGITDCICGLSRKQPYCDGSHKCMDKH